MAIARNIASPMNASPLARPTALVQRLVSFFLSRCVGKQESGERLLTLEGRLTIGPKETLTLVQCAGRRYLVAAGGGGIVSLTEVSSATLASTPVSPALTRRPKARREEQ
jgi:flagellar biogenesis protein FliO